MSFKGRYTEKGLPILSQSFVNNNFGNLNEMESKKAIERFVEENYEILEAISLVRKKSLNTHIDHIIDYNSSKALQLFRVTAAREMEIQGALCHYLLDNASEYREFDPELETSSGMPLGKNVIDSFLTIEYPYKVFRDGTKFFTNDLEKKDKLLSYSLKKYGKILGNSLIPPGSWDDGSIGVMLSAFGNNGSNFVYEAIRRQGEVYKLEECL